MVRISTFLIHITHTHHHHNAEIQTHRFAFIMSNYFCKDAHRNYAPAEIAATAFNFKSGILKSHHTYINPGMYLIYDPMIVKRWKLLNHFFINIKMCNA